jgi:hypothetical protein
MHCQELFWGYYMKNRIKSDKKVSPVRRPVKKNTKQMRKKSIEKEYETVFLPHPLPYQGTYTDEDSLEQPSALKYVPSTTTPAIGVTVSPRMRRDAELE